jgi:hypothetical protein
MMALQKAQTGDRSGSNAGQRNTAARAAEPAAPPTVNPVLLGRFRALIDEVTDELMEGRSGDRNSFRADAITLLIATTREVDGPADGAESPLSYLLREEQQKAAAVLGNSEPDHFLTFMKV